MSKYWYYGFSGKKFYGDYIEIAVDILSSSGLKGKPFVHLYSGGAGFHEYIDGCCCFIISDEITSKKSMRLKNFLGFEVGPDEEEWKVRGKIPLSSIKGIGLPMEQFRIFNWQSNAYFHKKVKELLALAQTLKLDIIDTSMRNFSSKYETEKEFSTNRLFDASLNRVVNGTYASTYFYHGIRTDVNRLLQILTSGGIKSKRLLGLSGFGYNEADYVSLCKKYPSREYKEYGERTNAFYTYTFNSFCLIISDDIPAFKLGLDDVGFNSLDRGVLGVRVSDMFDEWQVKDQIPLSSIIGIGIPIKGLKHMMGGSAKEEFETLRKVLLLAHALGLDIVDSSNPKFVEQYERKKLASPNQVYQEKVILYTNLGKKE